MDREEELAIVRRAYAKQILASVGRNDPRVESAFAAVERERYLGPGPWPILRFSGYVPTPEVDPVYLYCDVLIGIVPERGLNNGMPSYHAPLIASADIRAGEHVVHVGAGVGYYTAIMAQLVSPGGRVTAIEIDPALAQRASANCSIAAGVHVLQGDGFSVPFEAADVIYVNAGATHPADSWLDRLKDGGRLILPLTARKTLPLGTTGSIARHGAVFRIERKGDEYIAKWISAVGVYPCEGGRDDVSEAALDAALQKKRAAGKMSPGCIAPESCLTIGAGCAHRDGPWPTNEPRRRPVRRHPRPHLALRVDCRDGTMGPESEGNRTCP